MRIMCINVFIKFNNCAIAGILNFPLSNTPALFIKICTGKIPVSRLTYPPPSVSPNYKLITHIIELNDTACYSVHAERNAKFKNINKGTKLESRIRKT